MDIHTEKGFELVLYQFFDFLYLLLTNQRRAHFSSQSVQRVKMKYTTIDRQGDNMPKIISNIDFKLGCKNQTLALLVHTFIVDTKTICNVTKHTYIVQPIGMNKISIIR